MSLLPVEDARARILAGAKPLGPETLKLDRALGRVLARDLKALRDQPPFAASAMDGYAVRAADVAATPARLKVIGMAPAGHAFNGTVRAGEAVRIFTGGPMPRGTDTVVIQENTEADGDCVIVNKAPVPGHSVRGRGLDYRRGETLVTAGTRLDPSAIGLIAAMNHAEIAVRRAPRVTLFTTGDELVAVGGKPGPDQIVSSNSIALSAFIRHFGGAPRDLGIVPDRLAATIRAIGKAGDSNILVTTGGASVGDHDFVREALIAAGIRIDFWKIAMRPGKPLMFGRKGKLRVIGLPGNPVSALICARLFLKPLLDALLGLPPEAPPPLARLAASMPA
ncbi:MAG: molybdopterin molybdotransferase MoeA, partial [Rhizobiales bacterium]|nr:molybdopterin molybdotransferase MoeA [Hyphomicrobiales bacterium]